MNRQRHGMSSTPEYESWRAMRYRCNNKNQLTYKKYGEKGIEVCERWNNSFVNFYKDMGKRPVGKTLDRVDNKGNYEPENCRWATTRQQGFNKGNYKNNTSGYKGVYNIGKKWRSGIRIDGKFIIGKLFSNINEAINERHKLESIYFKKEGK